MRRAAADLLTPVGRLEGEALWPALTAAKVRTRLDGFLAGALVQPGTERLDDTATGAGDTALERFCRFWAYGRAYGEVFERINALPTSVDPSGEGASSYFVTQIQLMKELSDEAYATAQAVLDEVAAADPADSIRPRGSVSAPSVTVW